MMGCWSYLRIALDAESRLGDDPFYQAKKENYPIHKLEER